MNPTEQDGRVGLVTDRPIDTLATDVRDQMQQMRELIARLISAEHEDWVKVLRADRLMTDRNHLATVALNFYVAQFCAMNFRERLRWLMLGRMPAHIAEFTRDPEGALLAFPEHLGAEESTDRCLPSG